MPINPGSISARRLGFAGYNREDAEVATDRTALIPECDVLAVEEDFPRIWDEQH